MIAKLRWSKTSVQEQINDRVRDQYFENDENEANWTEYHDGEVFATFVEIDRTDNNNGGLEVLLLKTDGSIVKLTPESAFWGNEKELVNNLICNGGWQNLKENKLETGGEQEREKEMKNENKEINEKNENDNKIKKEKKTKKEKKEKISLNTDAKKSGKKVIRLLIFF